MIWDIVYCVGQFAGCYADSDSGVVSISKRFSNDSAMIPAALVQRDFIIIRL
jgi:hypothetical protein